MTEVGTRPVAKDAQGLGAEGDRRNALIDLIGSKDMQVIADYMASVHAANLYPDHYVCHAKRGNSVSVECETTGRQIAATNFGSNDILGLAANERVRRAAIDAIETFGTTNSSCATLCGRIELHRQLEREISDLKGLPHTYLFMNAWMALQAVFDGFCHLAAPVPNFRNRRETLILTDILNHGCITSAVVNADNRSGKILTHSPDVRVKAYGHVDMDDLDRKLARFARAGDRIVVVTDAVFSMDGDIAPLPDMLDVLERYPGSVLILDEAHSSGAIGATGRGICEHFGLSPRDIAERGIEPVIMTTFSKFAASAGAAISSYSREFIELLDVCPTSIGTISLPPPSTAAAIEAIRQLRRHPELPGTLRRNTVTLRRLLAERGFQALGETNVVPIRLPPGTTPKELGRFLLERMGVWVSPVWFIAKPRIRIVVNALHTNEELGSLVEAMVAAREVFAPAAVSA